MYFLDPHGLAVRNLAISKAIFNGAEDSAGESDGLYTQKISCQIAGYFGWHLTCSKIIACKLCAVGKACRWNLRNCSLEDLLHLWMMADSFQHTLSMPFENLSHQQTL